MQNDVLKNNIAPWQEKGRWYHGKINAVSGQFILNETDEFIINKYMIRSILGCYFLGPKSATGDPYIKLNPIDIKVKLRDFTLSSGTGQTLYAGYHYATGYHFLCVCPATNVSAGTAEFWVFVAED